MVKLFKSIHNVDTHNGATVFAFLFVHVARAKKMYQTVFGPQMTQTITAR